MQKAKGGKQKAIEANNHSETNIILIIRFDSFLLSAFCYQENIVLNTRSQSVELTPKPNSSFL